MGGVQSPGVKAVAAPAAPDLSTPLSSVKSYLDWTTYAYLIGDSDVATMTFSPAEEVRVNSYVQLNKEKGRLIEQKLVAFTPGEAGIDGTGRCSLRGRIGRTGTSRSMARRPSLLPILRPTTRPTRSSS